MPKYVALGSSFASGPGIEPLVHVGCRRSARNYSHLVAGELGLDLVDVSCGGATIDTLLDVAQELLTGGSVPPQIHAVTADTDLVTITVGGNDVDHMLNLYRYSYRAVPEPVPAPMRASFDTPVDKPAVARMLTRLPTRLAELVAAVEQRAPHGRVVLVDYLTVLPDQPPDSDRLPLGDADWEFCREVEQRLAAVTATAAESTGAELLRASELSRAHHALSDEPWVSGWEFGPVPGTGAVAYHPNAAGMAAVAAALLDLLP